MERDEDHWRARLPDSLVAHVVWPVRVEAHHDDGVPASKWRGYDVLGLLCYYRHHYSRWSAPYDDDEGAPNELQQQEDFEAWRTLLGTWVRRVQRVRREPSTDSDAPAAVPGELLPFLADPPVDGGAW